MFFGSKKFVIEFAGNAYEYELVNEKAGQNCVFAHATLLNLLKIPHKYNHQIGELVIPYEGLLKYAKELRKKQVDYMLEALIIATTFGILKIDDSPFAVILWYLDEAIAKKADMKVTVR